MSGEYISVGEPSKLNLPFKGNKSEVLAFIGNVGMAFSVISPNQEDILYKFVLICISGELRMEVQTRKRWKSVRLDAKNSDTGIAIL
jgi:hypothetical protein